MEHGLDDPLSIVQASDYKKHEVVSVSPIMANFPDGPSTQATENPRETPTTKQCVQVNGDGPQKHDDGVYDNLDDNPFQDSYSSESDALVIDESVPKKKKVGSKNCKKVKEIVRVGSERENDNDLSDPSGSKDKLFIENIINTTDAVKSIFNGDLTSDLPKNQPPQPNEVHDLSSNIFNESTQTSDNFSVNSDILEQRISEVNTQSDAPKFDSDISSNQDLLPHSNPFFRESLFELSQLHHTKNDHLCNNSQNIITLVHRTLKHTKSKPKLKEYAQYLGLQPAIQFKCPKCGKSGFESLLILQEHFLQCNATRLLEDSSENENVSGFKLTRKVFLCSACGTYYENWNLYKHMLEYHKRYICLYCLGMFSILDDLCQHIEARHNVEPGTKNTPADFYNVYNEPCYVVCCECNKQFSESENFFYHNCISNKPIARTKSKQIKKVVMPENHITGDFGTLFNRVMDNTESLENGSLKESQTECKLGPSKDAEQVCINDDKEDNVIVSDSPNRKDNNIQNCDNKILSKVSDGSSESENDLVSLSEKCVDSEHFQSADNIVTDKLDKNLDLDKSDNADDTEEGCEQESLGSSKISEDNEDHPTAGTMSEIDENHSIDSVENVETHDDSQNEPVETRKVPKLSLKLPKPVSLKKLYQEDSDCSDKLDIENDNIESENHGDCTYNDSGKEQAEDIEQGEAQHEDSREDSTSEENKDNLATPQYPVAGPEVPVIEIELDESLDKMDIRILLQKCLSATVVSCIYCNHSRRIAVNGKQLGLHAIAEHRFSAINKSITEEELTPESFNSRIKECLEQLETVFFNLESEMSDEAVTFSHVFECFQCHYSTTVHKELYLHNRKFHSKNLLLCIMCKSNFYSYSELICHLCPGVYVLDYDNDIHFRCCMCVSDDLPSSFRLMVHLRKKHNVCDVCLEMCHSQYKLSNHVWKHKLHHFCYRCGIAYRNKPDITRHLFWKHGTESVLCKRCLQKKWPHVYHFCVPPKSFTCDECSLVFTKAVALKVHKRVHAGEKRHSCTWEQCTEVFISNKLMLKHLRQHTDPIIEEVKPDDDEVKDELEKKDECDYDLVQNVEEFAETEEVPKLVKPKVDVYDLPELNLSESDSTDSESDSEKPKAEDDSLDTKPTEENINGTSEEILVSPTNEVRRNTEANSSEDGCLPNNITTGQPPIDETSSVAMQEIWDNFKNYQANKEKMDNMLIGEVDTKSDQPYVPDIPIPEVEEAITWQLALRDHDYSVDPEPAVDSTITEVKPSLESAESMDHDYCFQTEKENHPSSPKAATSVTEPSVQDETGTIPLKKRSISSSSSSSNSNSSCACGSSCSCSDSSSGNSSSSSDSSNSDSSTEEGRKRQQQRRVKRKEKNKTSKKSKPLQVKPDVKVDAITTDQPQPVMEMPIRESDLETSESETDEEFYDREPQKFAKKILEEKRAQLLSEMGPDMVPNGSFIESTSRPPTPPAGTLEEEKQPKRKKKTKKRKKRKSERKLPVEQRSYSATLLMDPEPVATPPSVPYYQQFHQTGNQQPTVAPITLSLVKHPPLELPVTPPLLVPSTDSSDLASHEMSDNSIRASKRRRVPNKFYGYSSDEEADKPHSLKRNKIEINRTFPAPASSMLVPPITIKTVSSSSVATSTPTTPTVEPITLRLPKLYNQSSDYKTHGKPALSPLCLSTLQQPMLPSKDDSATESNDSDVDERPLQPPPISTDLPKPPQPQLYCYCRCPYDEVSEMIGCDSDDCQIEWFHFECVGIMVPPKGQWFCPDCRKKKQQRGTN